jgi:hypothetical protein
MPRSPLYGLMPHQVIGGFQWRVHWWVLGWYNLHALVEKGCPFIIKNGLKKQMDGLNTSPPAICPPAFNEGRETICPTCYKTSWWTYITISVLGSVGRLTKCRPNIIYQLTSNNFESERNLLLSTGITVYFTQATLLNNIDWGF